MTISAGDKMPAGAFGIMTEAGPGAISTDDLFSGKKVVLVSVPGAFTPTCSASTCQVSSSRPPRYRVKVSIPSPAWPSTMYS